MNILNTFTKGKGWQHVVLMLCAAYLLKFFGLSFGGGVENNIGECLGVGIILGCVGAFIEWYQGKYMSAVYSIPDILWGIVGSAIGWGIYMLWNCQTLLILISMSLVLLVGYRVKTDFLSKKVTKK